MFPLTRVPFGVHIFDPQPCVGSDGGFKANQKEPHPIWGFPFFEAKLVHQGFKPKRDRSPFSIDLKGTKKKATTLDVPVFVLWGGRGGKRLTKTEIHFPGPGTFSFGPLKWLSVDRFGSR